MVSGMQCDVGLHNLLKTFHAHSEVILPDGKLGQKIAPRGVRLGCEFLLRAGLDSRDGGVGDDRTRGVQDDSIDFSRVHLTKPGDSPERQNATQKNCSTRNACHLPQHKRAST